MLEFILWALVFYAMGGGFTVGFFSQSPHRLGGAECALLFALWPLVWVEYFK